MRAWQVAAPRPVEERPLGAVELAEAPLGAHELRIRVQACGVCHTDLHVVEGDIPLPKLPVTPGHEIIGAVVETGAAVSDFQPGDPVGVAWLSWACGVCAFCRRGQENLCDNARFTGYQVDGGYATRQITDARFAYRLPPALAHASAAPLLCAGVVGYRALRFAAGPDNARLGLYGFGASAHLAIQIARRRGQEVYVFTRGAEHRRLAEELGARWTGAAEDDPGTPLDSSIIFAPAGALVPPALRALRKGGALVLAGIHMSAIPALDYDLLWGERVIRSVANATRQDAEELLALAAANPLQTDVTTFPLDAANDALLQVKRSAIRGAAVLLCDSAS